MLHCGMLLCCFDGVGGGGEVGCAGGGILTYIQVFYCVGGLRVMSYFCVEVLIMLTAVLLLFLHW